MPWPGLGSTSQMVLSAVFELNEDAGSAEGDGDHAEDGRDQAPSALLGPFDEHGQTFAPFFAETKLLVDLRPNCLRIEHRAGNCENNDQHWGHREDRVIGQCGAESRRFVLAPVGVGHLEHFPPGLGAPA